MPLPPHPRLPARLTPSRATLVVQLTQSATALVVSAVFMATLGAAGFGPYAIAQSAALLVSGMLDAAVLVPGMVHLARLRPESAARGLRRLRPTAALLVLLPLLALALALRLLLPGLGVATADAPALAAATLVLAAALALREWARQELLLRAALVALVAAEVASAVLAGLLLGAWLVVRDAADRSVADAVLLAAAAGLVPLAVLVGESLRARRRVGWRWHGAALLRRGGWSFAASQITWVQSQTYLYFAAALLSASAAGVLAAVRMIYQPLQTLIAGASRGWLAELSARRGRGVALARPLAGLAAAAWAWWLLMLAAREPLEQLLEGKGYTFDAALLAGWAAVFFFSAGRTLVTQVLRARRRFPALARQGLVGALLALLLVPGGIVLAGTLGAALGLAAVEAATLALGLRLARADGGPEDREAPT